MLHHFTHQSSQRKSVHGWLPPVRPRGDKELAGFGTPPPPRNKNKKIKIGALKKSMVFLTCFVFRFHMFICSIFFFGGGKSDVVLHDFVHQHIQHIQHTSADLLRSRQATISFMQGIQDTTKRRLSKFFSSDLMCTPQKSNIDTKNGHILRESTFSKPSFWDILGIHFSFRGCS